MDTKQPISTVIVGAAGRMGISNIQAVLADRRFRLSGLLVEPERRERTLGQLREFARLETDAQEAKRIANLPLCATIDDLQKNGVSLSAVYIDFSLPVATMKHLSDCVKKQIDARWVIGTTGFSHTQQEQIASLAEKVVVVKAGNFSLGINLLMKLCEKAATVLSKFDVEIIETHHRKKIDAPSGTAYMLADAVQKIRAGQIKTHRADVRKQRDDNEIGIASIRGGSVVGEHEVQFLGEHENLFLGHKATNRSLFSTGALVAAVWSCKQKPALYSMDDVLDTYLQ